MIKFPKGKAEEVTASVLNALWWNEHADDVIVEYLEDHGSMQFHSK